jgi:tetratricopeptide (TPR) repeat protein
LNTAQQDLRDGRANDAIAAIGAALAKHPTGNDAALAHNLLCRVYYQERRWTEAVGECQRAVDHAPGMASYHMWLGQTVGKQAEQAYLVTAYRLSRTVRDEFEAAVRLAPNDPDALVDLGEFDVDAPALLGGGLERAEEIAERLDKVNASRGHWLRGKIAESRKDTGTAEREYRAAVTAQGATPQAWMDVAAFYKRVNRMGEMDRAILEGVKADTGIGVTHADAGSMLVAMNRNMQYAAEMIRAYLASPNKSEQAPAFVMYDRLARALDAIGDRQGAAQARAQSRALSSGYIPEH